MKPDPAQKLSPAPPPLWVGRPGEEGPPLIVACTDVKAKPTARDHVLRDVTEVSHVDSGSVVFTDGKEWRSSGNCKKGGA